MSFTNPTIAGIDVYGNGRTPDATVLDALGLREGQPWRPEMCGLAEGRVAQLGVFRAVHLAAITYGDGRVFLTVDVVERDAPPFRWRRPPSGDAELPPELAEALGRKAKRSELLWQLGQPSHEHMHPDGYFLSDDAELAQAERDILTLVNAQLQPTIAASRDAPEPATRADAATALGYASDHAQTIPTLVDALLDASFPVRNNAARVLIPIAQWAIKHGVAFPIEPVIDLLHAPLTTDRNKASAILLELAVLPTVRERLRARAIPALRAMSQLKQPNNREHALLLLGML